MQNVMYPDLKLVLEREFDAWVKTKGFTELPAVRPLAKKIMAASQGSVVITHSSLHDWIGGRAKPQSEKIDALAKFLAPQNAKEQDRIKTAIIAATETAQSISDPLDAIFSKAPRGLNIGIIDFKHFCGLAGQEPNGFLGRIIKRFLSFSGLEKIQRANFEIVEINEVEERLCEEGSLDMVLGLFVDPSRTHRQWFYHQLPIVIPLNCVYALPRNVEITPKYLLAQMTKPNTAEAIKDQIQPLIDPAELGGIYMTNYVGFPDSAYTKAGYNLGKWASEMVRLASLTTQRRIPICSTDEVGCINIFLKAKEEIGQDNPALANKLDFVRGIGKETDHYFPSYRYGLALAKRHARWTQFFEECFELFVESNIEFVSECYNDLREKLISQFNDPALKHIEKAVDNWLSLPAGIERRTSEGWLAVLKHPNIKCKRVKSRSR